MTNARNLLCLKFVWKNIEFWVQFASVSERLLVSFFSTIWRNIKWFQRVDTVSICFVHIWKRVHKKSEGSEALSSWCFFRLNEVAIFSKFAIYFIKILLSLWFFWPHSTTNTHITGCRYFLIDIWSKKGDEYFWKITNGVHLSKFPIIGIYFKLYCSRYSETKHIFPWFLVMAWSCKRDSMWKMLEISCTENCFEKNIELRVQFASVS